MAPCNRPLFILLILFSTISFIRLLSSVPAVESSLRHRRLFPSLRHRNATAIPQEDALTPKEYKLLETAVLRRRPCNLLFFGLTAESLRLSKLNAGGRTVFLGDRPPPRDLRIGKKKGASFHLAGHRHRGGDAYRLLREAREAPACRPGVALGLSRCPLALSGLPPAVAERSWDVIVVDGPSGAAPEELGRMSAIYSSAVIARAAKGGGGAADVFVHNVDRSAERWYAWEFLCEENLVSARGRLWQFSIAGRGGADAGEASFCTKQEIKIL